MEVIIIVWLVAPIVLGILLAINLKKNKSLNREIDEKKQLLATQKNLLDEYRNQNRALQQALREARGMDGSLSSKTVEAKTEAVVAEEAKTDAVAAEQVKAEAVAAEQVKAEVVAAEEVKTVEVATETFKPETVALVKERTESVKTQVKQNVDVSLQKQKPGIAPGSILFGIGILLILAAGAIFATTTWNILPAFGKIAVLLGAVAVFYGGAFVAEKKLELRNTSITFYILGSTFLAIINLAAGYFEWYGPYYSLSGDGGMMLWSISALITAVCMIIGAIIYRTKVLGMIGYYSLIISVILFNLFVFDDIVPTLIAVGIVLLLSHAYVLFVEEERESYVIRSSAKMLSYVYHIVAFLVCLLDYGFFRDDEPSMWPVIGLVVLAIVNLGLSAWRMLTEFGQDDVTNTLEERLDCAKLVNIIFTGAGIVAFAVAFRAPFHFYQRLNISLVIFLVMYGALLFLEKKEIYFERIKVCVSWFAEVNLFVVMFSELWLIYDYDMRPKGIILLVTAIVLYVMEHISEDNKRAVLSAITCIGSISYILFNWLDADVDKNTTIVVIAAWVIAIAIVVAGRFIYKTVIRKTEQGLLIDWISICSIILLIFAGVSAGGNDVLEFVTELLIAAYFASFYKRSIYVIDGVMLTIATVLAAFTLDLQPFFEIPYEFDSEWNTLFFIAAVAVISVIWRKHKKACSIMWIVAIAIAFAAQLDTAGTYSYRGDGVIGMIKVTIYLAEMIALFIVSYVRKKKALLIEVGFAMIGFSTLAWSYEAKGIFILAAILGIAYLVYLHISKISKWAFLPIVQIYILLFALHLSLQWWFVVYAVSLVAGFGLHLLWDNENEKSFADDLVNISAIVPVFVLWADGGDKWIFASLIMLAVYFLSFYRRYNDNPYALINRSVLTLSSAMIAIAWITQPWFEVSQRWRTEWIIIAFMGMCIFNMLFVYRHSTDELWGWITFAVAVISVVVQGENAISTGYVIDALILGVVMLAVLIWAYIAKKKQWFLLAGIALIAQSIYASREFWKSIAWWVYLLAAGAILIIVAARSEYKKRKGIEDEPGKPHAFADWTL